MSPNSTSDFAALNSRVRVMFSTLLTKQGFANLSESTDFVSLITLLKSTAYGPYLERAKENELTARRAAFQIHGRLSEAFHSIIHSSPDYSRAVLTQFYRYYEINNLKAVLRGIITESPWDRVKFVLFPYGPEGVLPAQAMIETGNVTQAIELIKNTPYYETLSFAMKRFNAEQSLFPIEVALDLDYWRVLWKEIKNLPRSDQEFALRVVGPILDMNNLMWAIRYRTYHNLSEEEIINYTLPIGYHVHDEDIRSIAAGADIPQIIKRIYPELTGVDGLLQNLHSGLPQLELLLQKHVSEQCRAVFSGNPFQIGIPLGYLVLFEDEIQDLTVLLEAKASNLPVEKYRSFILNEM
ncbi:MAG: V-type ATPase subunit [Anaerolineaceae bacterium]